MRIIHWIALIGYEPDTREGNGSSFIYKSGKHISRATAHANISDNAVSKFTNKRSSK